MKQIILFIIIQFTLISFCIAQTDTLWTKTYGSYYSDGANAVCEDFDGSVVLAGYTYAPGAGGADIYLVKTDDEGNFLYSNTFGGSGWEIAYSICSASDSSGYIVTGHTSSFGAGSKDVFLLKTDHQLNQLWFKTFGGIELDVGKSVITTSDDGYVICGYTESFGAGEDDIYLIKTDSNGDSIWTKTIGCFKSDMGQSVYETSDGHLIITGSTGLYDTPGVSTGRNSDIFVVKTDLAGNVINSTTMWCIDNDQGDFDMGTSICETSDGNYCVVGMSSAEGVEVMDFSIIKMDTSLTVIWKKRKEAGYYDFGYSICATTPDSGIIVCGKYNNAQSSNSDALIVKLDGNGDEQWRRTYGGLYGGDQNDGVRCVKVTSDGNFIIAGQTNSYGEGSYDIWLLKLQNVASKIDDIKPVENKSFQLNQNYPNPFNPTTTISFYLPEVNDVSLTLFDLNGREVRTLFNKRMSAGKHNFAINAEDLASGVYFYKMDTAFFSKTRKLIVLK